MRHCFGSRRWAMTAVAVAVAALSALTGCAEPAAAPAKPLQANMLLDGGRVVLPNGWQISPAGRTTKLPGDMPMRMIFAPAGQQLLVNTGGYNQHGISVLDAHGGELVQNVK